ncbi:MAG: Stealth CR1 domain-containing protein, partial [Planctomycetaceae bacterium]|nr:Stealth CR1 domain-containing protein [Planctomycetaceae bacterium]
MLRNLMSNDLYNNANGKQQSSLSVGQFPIDLVYLWVDGSDPVWLAKKNATLAAMNEPLHSDAATPDRFDDKDELKFSLRSVEKNMPWINHIYIVTDNQVPKWLNTENPRISIVDHRDIVPPEYLPTFNATALELFLHKIPGLSEHYIFANDDFFAGSPLTPEFFFNPFGDPIVMIREKRYLQNIFSASGFAHAFQRRKLLGRMILNALRLVHELTGKRYYMTVCHSMEAMRKSYMEDIMSQHGDKLIPDTATAFRKQNNIQRIFFPLYN